MKKLMVAAFAMAMAVSAQAVMVNWSSGCIFAPGEDGTGWSVNLDPLVTEPSTAYTITLTLATNEALSENKFVDSVSYIDADSYAGKATGDSFSKGSTYYGQMIITDGTKTLSSELFKFSIDADHAGAYYDITVGEGGVGIQLASGDPLDGDIGAFQAAGWQSVPEPTSGLLLLLGMAGLALKRKRA